MPATTNVKSGWFQKKHEPETKGSSNAPLPKPSPVKKKRLVLSQTLKIDLDPNKVSSKFRQTLNKD